MEHSDPAQPALHPAVIVFSTQEQVDNFPIIYPGCTIIDGNVGVTGSEIMNLDGLSQITQIGGNVLINADSLSSVVGLAGLTSIGGSLSIQSPSLTAPLSLPNLQSAASIDLYTGCIQYSFNQLQHVAGHFTFNHTLNTNPAINFSALESIDGDLGLYGILPSTDYFPQLTTINGWIRIDVYQLYDITGFQNLTFIGGSVEIQSNENIETISGFQQLHEVNGDFRIIANPALLTIPGFPVLENIGGNIIYRWKCNAPDDYRIPCSDYAP
jgi:hypothetical protein